MKYVFVDKKTNITLSEVNDVGLLPVEVDNTVRVPALVNDEDELEETPTMHIIINVTIDIPDNIIWVRVMPVEEYSRDVWDDFPFD